MRVDYFHTGDAKQEMFSFDEAVVEPAAWSGRAGREVDPLGYGAYGFDVRDAASKALLYSRGFGSIFDEWSTTDEATKITRTFHESVRFPVPRRARHRDHPQAWRQRHHLARPVDDDRRPERTCS